MRRLEGRVAIVTGAAAGIGAAIARAFVAEGARVVVADRDLAAATRTAAAFGDAAFAFDVDVTQEAPVQALAQAARSRFGRIDILVNNAGIMRKAFVKDMTEALWDAVVDVNLKATFLCSKAVLPAMIEARRGRIINIASISALIANRGIGGRDYETGKAAVLHFTRCAAADWAPHGITVNAICPGLFMTDINRQWNERRPDVIAAFVQNVPMGRPGEPDEIGPLALYLASDASSYMTGSVIIIDGGRLLW